MTMVKMVNYYFERQSEENPESLIIGESEVLRRIGSKKPVGEQQRFFEEEFSSVQRETKHTLLKTVVTVGIDRPTVLMPATEPRQKYIYKILITKQEFQEKYQKGELQQTENIKALFAMLQQGDSKET